MKTKRGLFSHFRPANVSAPRSIKQGPKAREGLVKFPTTNLPKSLRGKTTRRKVRDVLVTAEAVRSDC
jgi:hypothetical protein